MTLDTRIWLHGVIPWRKAFDLGLHALLDAADRGSEFATAQVKDYGDGNFSTVLGQGLPGIVDIKYNGDGPLATEDIYEAYDERWHDSPEDVAVEQRACTVELSWDTSYGYHANGLSCTELHAKALVLFHQSLPAGVTMTWQDEYRGTVHNGLDGLVDFLGGGDEANEWFTSIVQPAIEHQFPGVRWSE